MSLTKTFTSAAIALSLSLASLAPLASAAQAHEWHRGGYAHLERGRDHDRGFDRRDRDEGFGYRRHHNNDGRNFAIGAFATVLGIALASEANRVQHDYYEDRD